MTLGKIAAILFFVLASTSLSRAQNLEKPATTIDEEVTAFSYAPDGRIAFSVRKMYKLKKYDLQRDDIYVLQPGGKRIKLFNGQKFTLQDKPFTYQVESFTWSPNGHILAVQLFTSSVDPEDGHAEDARALLFVDDSGRTINAGGKDPLLMNAENPLWLRDNTTLVYLSETIAPRALFSLQYMNLTTGTAGKAFEGRTFVNAARIPGSNLAIAIERDNKFDGPARMQRLELLAQDDKELATLDAFSGELMLSPSGTKAAYFLDKEILEIRDLTALEKVARLRVGLGVLQWSADESRFYLKRTTEKKSGDLVSFATPALVAYKQHEEIPVDQPVPQMLLHGLTVREFGISPDGKFLAVVLPGKRTLQIFSMN
jgi:hypothetical protein